MHQRQSLQDTASDPVGRETVRAGRSCTGTVQSPPVQTRTAAGLCQAPGGGTLTQKAETLRPALQQESPGFLKGRNRGAVTAHQLSGTLTHTPCPVSQACHLRFPAVIK